MNYYKTCPHCGANLNPGELCDCQKKKAPASAANTDEGGVEKVLEGSDSTSSIQKN